jgi:AhpD family alkylhydroperoxidase
MTQRLQYQTLAAAGMRALGGVYQYVAQSGLPPDLIDLVFLRASQINGCAYCVDMHSRDALKKGVPAEKLFLVAVWPEAGATFTERERAALAWTEAVTLLADTQAPDEEYEALAAQFTEQEIADLTLAIALINSYNRMAVSFRRGPEGAAHG